MSVLLLGVVAELSNQLEKVKHELAQLKKAHIGPKSERSKMPRVPTKPVTADERLAKRRTQAADRAQTQTVRTEHKVPLEERTCPSCGNENLKPIGTGRTTAVYEFVPARFVRHEHVQECCAAAAATPTA
jgi:transposase